MPVSAPRIPIALMGTGGMAYRHFNGLDLLYHTDYANVELAAVVGRTQARAEALADEAARKLGRRPRVYADVAELARSMPEIQAVDVVTDAGSHHSLTVAALEAGLHALVEKPLALTVRGCDWILNAARGANRFVSVAENYRRDPINRLARALIADGAIGDPRFMIESRTGGGSEIFLTPWRHQKLTGTVVFDVGVHYADILEQFMGEAESVYGEGRLYERRRRQAEAAPSDRSHAAWSTFYSHDTSTRGEEVEATGEDALFAQVRFRNGGIAHWTSHYAAHGQPEFRRVVYGSTGTLRCPNDRTGGPLILERDGGRQVSGVALLDLAPSYRLGPLAARLFGGERIAAYELSYPEVDARLLALELHELGECIAGNRAPEVGAEAGRRAVALVNAVFESGLAGRAVTLEEVERLSIDAYQREIDAHYGLLEERL